MLIQIILSLFLGIIFGTITGLIPGIHTNLVGVFIISISTFFIFINPIYLIVIITAMAITHTFIDFIPSVFLGCPDTDTELSVLPGHKLLKEGKGYEAILLTTYGSLAAIIILILISVPAVFLIPKIYDLIQNFIPYIIILTSIILISLEKHKLTALSIFLLTGFLGFVVLNLDLKEPLLPLLTGLFGSSALVLTIKTKTQIPPQIITKPKAKLFKPIIGAAIASPLCSFLPGLGSGQAAVIGNLISKTKEYDFLILVGATNTLVMGVSFISLYAISKTRTGAAVAIKEIIGIFSWKVLVLIIIIIVLSSIISFFLTCFLAKSFSQKIEKVNYTLLTSITLIILITVVFLMSGILGLIVLTTSTFTGIYAINSKARRTNMMGCLMIPTIILYLF
jgi:putative membrane protein